MATLKVYADRISQPSRAVILFCKVGGIDFEEVPIDLFKAEHRTPDFEEVNPFKQVPAIVHGDFKLNESHAILTYIASASPGVADHWYPADLQKRAKLHSLLDWHHTNLRRGAMGYLLHTVLAPIFNTPDNPIGSSECEKTLLASFSAMESVWLQGNDKFLLGGNQPSIADLSLVSEIMQLQLLDEKEQARLLGPYKKVQKWIEDVKNATNPHFENLLDEKEQARLLGPYKKVQKWIEDVKNATNPHFENVHDKLFTMIAMNKGASGHAK
ncbi:hypothetical protein V2J09_022452 [Rumex salicifolius]